MFPSYSAIPAPEALISLEIGPDNVILIKSPPDSTGENTFEPFRNR